MLESTYRALCYTGAGCLSCVGTYLPGTVLQCFWLFKRCQNLTASNCVSVVKAVLAMSEPTWRALCYSDAGCLSIVGIYLPGTVLQGCRLFKYCRNLGLCCRGAGCFSNVRTYLPGTVIQWCRLFKRCQNLPAGHCVTVVQTV